MIKIFHKVSVSQNVCFDMEKIIDTSEEMIKRILPLPSFKEELNKNVYTVGL